MVDVKGSLDSNQTVLLMMPSASYNDVIVDSMKQLSGSSICYVALNKTFDSLKEEFDKAGVDTEEVVFIDAISKTIKKAPDSADQVYYCSSPGALTEISVAVGKFLRHEFDYVIFDSLTSLLVYQKKAPVSKFVSDLVGKIKKGKTKGLFYALSSGEQAEIIKASGMYVDKVIDTEK